MGNQPISQVLLDIYRRLMARYGRQYWWPAETPFEMTVGALLTQSTSWRNVEKAIASLKAARALSPPTLRRLSLPEIAALIRASGYYHVKAHKLKSLALWLGDYCDDNLEELFREDTNVLRRQLLSVHGIGPETADSILLYAAGKPVFVVDAYTRRIVSRLGLASAVRGYSAYQSLFTENLPADVGLFNEYHALLVRLAKDTCRKRPLCRRCCLNVICRFDGTAE